MSDTFLSKDPVSSKHEIIEMLYKRLALTRDYMERNIPDNEFNRGLDCGLYYEVEWLEIMLDKIERS